MPAYTVHAPTANGVDLRADRVKFVRDGFHFWAMVFGPVWLLWHRLWLALIGWLIFAGALEVALVRLGIGGTSILLIDAVVALLTGFEAASLRRWTLSRGNWRQLDVVVADDEEAAERRFFERWSRRGVVSEQAGVDPGAPPPVRGASRQPPPLPAGGIIGLFPEAGGSR
ncbi:MAG: DUF2628 domain-containing protein [Bradyrhizobium sp.]|uniref:DUF2628 domain-containing protein n=1 Tax=Bradyrhizobium sp. TaxID=376 RepID=UPI0025BB4797|nr:DUF2628 domain-containing protein [Bradyrhizobium sp.]MBI5261621.1 DUF2628 domain-containing protein [Bradyrhizobium sp.]